MCVIIAPIQIKPGYKEQFIEEMIGDARCWANNEPGCLSFAVIQNANNPNRIWLYEVYKDVAAFQGHTQAPHFSKWRDAVVHWRDETSLKGEEMAVPSSPGEKGLP